MMSFFLFIFAGGLVTLGILLDLAHTTLSAQGVGPLTSAVGRAVSSLVLRIKPHRRRPRWITVTGPLLMVMMVTIWVSGLGLGLMLILSADASSIVGGSTGGNASVTDRFYFAGYTISTMGNGDFRPAGMGWQMVTVVYSLFGFGILTATISYLVQVLSAVTRQQQLAVSISILGETPGRILQRGWDGKGFGFLNSVAEQLCSQVIQHSRSHAAYPIIHHFTSAERRHSVVLNLVILDEAISMLFHASEVESTDLSHVMLLRRALDEYLATVNELDLKIDPAESWSWDTQAIDDLPPIFDKETIDAFPPAELNERRRLLSGLLSSEGWSNDVVFEVRETR